MTGQDDRSTELGSAKRVIAFVAEKKNCSGGELWLNPVTIKGVDSMKPKTQLLQQRTRDRKRTIYHSQTALG